MDRDAGNCSPRLLDRHRFHRDCPDSRTHLRARHLQYDLPEYPGG